MSKGRKKFTVGLLPLDALDVDHVLAPVSGNDLAGPASRDGTPQKSSAKMVRNKNKKIFFPVPALEAAADNLDLVILADGHVADLQRAKDTPRICAYHQQYISQET